MCIQPTSYSNKNKEVKNTATKNNEKRERKCFYFRDVFFSGRNSGPAKSKTPLKRLANPSTKNHLVSFVETLHAGACECIPVHS